MKKLLAIAVIAALPTQAFAFWQFQMTAVVTVPNGEANEVDIFHFIQPSFSTRFETQATCEAWRTLRNGVSRQFQIQKPGTNPVETIEASITYMAGEPCQETP